MRAPQDEGIGPFDPAGSASPLPRQRLETVLHLLFQVVTGTAKLSVAAGDEILLRLPQRARLAGIVRFVDDPGVGGRYLAIEIGELRAGADRLLDRAPRG